MRAACLQCVLRLAFDIISLEMQQATRATSQRMSELLTKPRLSSMCSNIYAKRRPVVAAKYHWMHAVILGSRSGCWMHRQVARMCT